MDLVNRETGRLYRTLLRNRGPNESPLTPAARRAMLIRALRKQGPASDFLMEEKVRPVAVLETADRLGHI